MASSSVPWSLKRRYISFSMIMEDDVLTTTVPSRNSGRLVPSAGPPLSFPFTARHYTTHHLKIVAAIVTAGFGPFADITWGTVVTRQSGDLRSTRFLGVPMTLSAGRRVWVFGIRLGASQAQEG